MCLSAQSFVSATADLLWVSRLHWRFHWNIQWGHTCRIARDVAHVNVPLTTNWPDGNPTVGWPS